HAETDTAARELELQKTRQRIAQLESEIRSTLETHLRHDALRFGLALRDLETILDDYEKGIDPFVEQLHSFSGRFQLYRALGGDLVSFPGKAFQKTGQSLQNRVSSSHWQTVRSGELLHAIETALQADYGFPETETVVETVWRQSFDHRVDLAGLAAARIQRLAHELEAS